MRSVAGQDLPPDELQQIVVETILVGIGDAVRRARILDQLRAGDQLDRGAGGRIDRNDLVVIAVDDQRRHVEALEILGEVGGRERRDGIVGVLVAAEYTLHPERIDQALRRLGTRTVEAEERAGRYIAIKL